MSSISIAPIKGQNIPDAHTRSRVTRFWSRPCADDRSTGFPGRDHGGDWVVDVGRFAARTAPAAAAVAVGVFWPATVVGVGMDTGRPGN